MTKQTNKVLFAFVSFPYLKICFPVSQMFREREGLLSSCCFPFIEKAWALGNCIGNRVWDRSKCWQMREFRKRQRSWKLLLVFHLAKFKWRGKVSFFFLPFFLVSAPSLSLYVNKVHFCGKTGWGKDTFQHISTQVRLSFCLAITYCEIEVKLVFSMEYLVFTSSPFIFHCS